MSENQGSTTQLKRVLGFKDLFLACVGWVIGAGVMTILSAGIGITGRSIPIAFLIATVIMIFSALPLCFVAGTVRLRGGTYTIMAMFGGKTLAGISIFSSFLNNITFVTLGISFASYWISLFGWGNEKLIAVIILTVFYALNILGIDKFAKAQNLLVIFLLVALASYAACGIGKVDPDYFNTASAEWLLNGTGGLFRAGALMTFCLGGANGAFALSGQAKNPTRDVPLAVILSTAVVAVVYSIIAVITAGVLPVAEVANKNLAVVAEAIMPHAMYICFIIFGAGFAICSTLNAKFAAATPMLLQAIDDGWFPKKLATLSRWKTPWIILTALWAFGVVAIVGGLSLSAASSISIIAGNFINIFMCMSAIRLPKIIPDAWAKSKYHCSMPVLILICVLGSLASLVSIVLNMSSLTPNVIMLNIIFLVVAWAYTFWRRNKVDLAVSYEDN